MNFSLRWSQVEQNMGGSWYLRRSAELIGPIPFQELRKLASTGELTPDDEVRSGHGYWQEARSVDELWSDLTLPLSEDVSVGSSVAAVIGGSQLDDAAQLMHGDPPADERRYLCHGAADGNEAGPFSLTDLQEQVATGRLNANDRVRAEGSLCWIPCRELTGLQFPAIETSNTSSPGERTQNADVEEPDWMFQDESAAPEDQESSEDTTTADGDEFDPTAVLNEEPPAPTPLIEPEVDAADVPPAPVPSDTASIAASRSLSGLMTELGPDPDATKGPTKTKSPRGRGRGWPRFSLPNSWLVYVLAGLLILYGLLQLSPSRGGIYGEVLVDGTPLPVGSLTINPQGGHLRDGLSIGVIDGNFESGDDETLASGSYDVLVTIGNPLGIPSSELDESPVLAALNGAKLTTLIQVEAGEAILVSLNSSDAVPLEDSGVSFLNTE